MTMIKATGSCVVLDLLLSIFQFPKGLLNLVLHSKIFSLKQRDMNYLFSLCRHHLLHKLHLLQLKTVEGFQMAEVIVVPLTVVDTLEVATMVVGDMDVSLLTANFAGNMVILQTNAPIFIHLPHDHPLLMQTWHPLFVPPILIHLRIGMLTLMLLLT